MTSSKEMRHESFWVCQYEPKPTLSEAIATGNVLLQSELCSGLSEINGAAFSWERGRVRTPWPGMKVKVTATRLKTFCQNTTFERTRFINVPIQGAHIMFCNLDEIMTSLLCFLHYIIDQFLNICDQKKKCT